MSETGRFKLILGALVSPFFAFLFVLVASRFGYLMDLEARLSPTNWAIVDVLFVESPQGPVLVLMASNEPVDSEYFCNRLLVIAAKDGNVAADRVVQHNVALAGITPELVWCEDHASGKDMKSYGLPALDARHDVQELIDQHAEVAGIVRQIDVDGNDGALRLDARDGYHYRLLPSQNALERLPAPPPPLAPTLLQAAPKCRWKVPGPIMDCRTGKPMRIAKDSIWIGYESVAGENRLVVERRHGKADALWTVRESVLFGLQDQTDPSKRVSFATRDDQRVYLVVEDRDPPEDLYLSAVDLENGAVVWHHRFR